MILNIQKLILLTAVAFTSVSALSIVGHGSASLQGREPSAVVAAREEVRSFEPSRVIQGRSGGSRPQPSGSSSNKKCIKITKKIGGATIPIGYLSENYVYRSGVFKVTWNKWDCLKVVVPTGSGPFDLPIYGENGSKKYLGLAGHDGLKASYPVKTRQTSVDSRPQNVGNDASDLPLSESAVWSVDGNTLTAIWWPENGAKINVKTMLWPQQLDYLYFVTKPAEFSQTARGAFEVTLQLTNP
ncbi:hypothetical protein MD484_g1599, partial [Candolleomyces efflorescens]